MPLILLLLAACSEGPAFYIQVMRLAESAGRDPMLAAYPLLLSGYVSDTQSRDCARGPWQLGLEDERVQIGPCRLRDSLEP